MTQEKPVERMYRAMKDAKRQSESKARHGRASDELKAARAEIGALKSRVSRGERPTEDECRAAIKRHNAAM